MNFEDQKLTIVLEDGTEKECLILFTFESIEYDANYVVYFPADQAEAEEIDLMVSKYEETTDEGGKLIHIDEDAEDEWAMIETAIDEYEKEFEGEED